MWIVALLALCSPAGAQVSVPPELRGWEDWVLHGHETHRCAWLVPGRPTDDSRVCGWPSVLELSVDEHGGLWRESSRRPAPLATAPAAPPPTPSES
jgi:hypothetical protein